MKRVKLVIGIGCGCVLIGGVAWWAGPKIDECWWEWANAEEAPAEWDVGESRARYVVPKDGRGKPFLVLSDAMLKGETPLSLKEAGQILDNEDAWSMMSEEGRTNLVECLKAQAEHPAAQYLLGVCFRDGKGVEKSDAEAITWWRRAAEQGHRDAQCNLGGLLLRCEGGEKTDAEAVEWLRKAARQGDVLAQCNLGYCYQGGEGVEQSFKNAARWFRRAAERDDWKACYELGLCYATGRGVEKSAENAIHWFRQAVKNGLELPESIFNYIKENE